MSERPSFTPTPEEMAGTQPGQVLKISLTPEVASGPSKELLQSFSTDLVQFYAALEDWKKAREDVAKQIALLNGWVGVLQTFTEKVLPMISGLVNQLHTAPGTGAGLSSSGIVGKVEGVMANMQTAFNTFKELTSLIPKIG